MVSFRVNLSENIYNIIKFRRKKMKVLCVLYDDPKGGMPKSYPLNDLPKLEK